jgi:hypothetical protein
MRFMRGSCQLVEEAMTFVSTNQFFEQGFHTVAVSVSDELLREEDNSVDWES